MTTRSKMPGKEIAVEAALVEEVNKRLLERLFATDRRNVYVCTSSDEDEVEVVLLLVTRDEEARVVRVMNA
ncbi:hypothetical protein DY000_02049322 [Brassica cretica]|uniref:Uncharacterized protein n=1 Tax=Brassica cretica TaxID=69181 RepID=A0ABQ7F512_BRACR|nr:hypothetical protein DY000_02049322 [Brassica cretica]